MSHVDPIPMTPAELRPIETSLDALAAREAGRAPAGLEDRIAASTAPRLGRAPGFMASRRRLWIVRAAAAVALAAIAGVAVYVGGGGASTPAAGGSVAAEAAALEAELGSWLNESTWSVVAAEAGGSDESDDLLEDFWPSLNDPLVSEESL